MKNPLKKIEDLHLHLTEHDSSLAKARESLRPVADSDRKFRKGLSLPCSRDFAGVKTGKQIHPVLGF